jgi:hypothetical protein
MNIEVLKSKIHRATITEANLNYIGSITIDEDLMEASNLIEGEKVSIYNITNGDFFRWEQIWEKVGDLFDLPLGPPQSISLQQFMADKTSTWPDLAEVHGLVTPYIEKAVNWSFGDYIFNCDWDIMASTTKARQHGFESFEDSEHMFSQILTEMAQARMIPPL